MRKLLILFLVTFPGVVFTQGVFFDKVTARFEQYAELPREVVYLHLNKSIYIKGELLGFKAYVLDKDNRLPSMETRNLYCILEDESGRTVKEQLIQITSGVGSGIMKLDSLPAGPRFRLKAYTNWMRNFSEPNHFEEEITILDPDRDRYEPLEDNSVTEIDAQFLPESGHAVAGLEAVYGVVIKDQNGYGIPFVNGTVIDEEQNFVTSFKVNAMGIGRMGFVTTPGKRYSASFTYENKQHIVPLPLMKPQGIVLKLQDLISKVGLTFSAKFSSQLYLEAPYLLTIHNGNDIKALNIIFDGKPNLVKAIPKEKLFPGINVITLFNDEGKPILERVYFNYVGLNFHSNVIPKVEKIGDSLQVTVQIKETDPQLWNGLSASVLPHNTISYKPHHNLPSYFLLYPYVKGLVENGAYYFRDITAKKAFELDNLLITQGWSSYEWNDIFTKPPKYLYDFEKGLSYKVNLNRKANNKFYIFPTANNLQQYVDLEKDRFDFSIDQFFPNDREKLAIAEVGQSGSLQPPKVFIQFKPSAVPKFDKERVQVLAGKAPAKEDQVDIPNLTFESIERLQLIDEVVVVEDRTRTRLERLENKTWGNVDVFEDNDPRRNQLLSNYLSQKGFAAYEFEGEFFISSRNPGYQRPLIYLDGVLLTDLGVLSNFRLDIVDYIEVNKSGIGGGTGLASGGGIIRIYTDPFRRMSSESEVPFTSYQIPLTFASAKRFYNPVYPTYTSAFFHKYGTLDWQPDLQLDKSGNLSFRIKDFGLKDIKVFLEGMVNGTDFVSDIIHLNVE